MISASGAPCRVNAMTDHGGRLDALQEQLGHRDINTTRIYLRLTSEDVMREVSKIEF